MKNFKHLCTLLLTALTFAACSNDEIVEPQQSTDAGITFTAVFGVKNGTTRALTDPNDGTLTASWAVGEEIAIVFNGNKYTASVTEVDDDGNATVSATLPSNTPNNQAVTFIYPASAADGSGLRSNLLGSQDGTLATLSSTLDVATAPGKLVVDGSAAQPNGTVTLENQYAICKFQFTDETDRPIIIESVTITDLSTTEVITVTTPSAQPAVYVAMLPSQNSTKFEVVSNDGSSYTKTANARMEAGMFYRPTFKTVCVFDSKTVPLTFKAIDNCRITIDNSAEGSIVYSIDGSRSEISSGAWRAFNLTADQEVEFYGDNSTYNPQGSRTRFSIEGQCYIYGNIMSLISSTNFSNLTEFTSSGVFASLFENCSTLRSHPGKRLVLPATTLTYGCYESMFSGCSGLTRAPELPATTLTDYCYAWMFQNCSGLTKVPAILPATVLKKACYNYMFYGCSSLTEAPELPAPTLTEHCYMQMFSGCSNLNSVKCLATSMSANNCTFYWLLGVASTGTFTKAAGADWSSMYAEGSIPSGWTVVEE